MAIYIAQPYNKHVINHTDTSFANLHCVYWQEDGKERNYEFYRKSKGIA